MQLRECYYHPEIVAESPLNSLIGLLRFEWHPAEEYIENLISSSNRLRAKNAWSLVAVSNVIDFPLGLRPSERTRGKKITNASLGND